MKGMLLVLLLLVAIEAKCQSKLINLNGKKLDFHSCPIASSKYKDFECCALNYNASDSFWDFVDMVRDSVSINTVHKFSKLRDKSYATFK